MSAISSISSPPSQVSQKRFSERDSDADDEYNISSSSSDFTHNDPAQSIKRFKGLNGHNSGAANACLESPINFKLKHRTPNLFQNEARFQEPAVHAALSPISELSMNLTETFLNSSTGCDCDDGSTPNKRSRRGLYGRLPKECNLTEVKDPSIISARDYSMDDKLGDEGFQVQRSTRNPLSRRLNLDSSLPDMGMDELSFYDDDHIAEERHFTNSPQLMGLLSPEGSPQRFQIVEKSSNKGLQTRNVLTVKSADKNKNYTSTTNTCSNTPLSKGFRVFQSSSSSGVESSMDDEYMEFFDLENMEQQQSSGLNFPSDLNSLISGHIIKNSPVKTPEIRRPSVRRCLSMTENVMQSQPSTPELLYSANCNNNNNNSRLNGNCCFKRPEPPSTTCSPIQSKRYRGAEKENLDGSLARTSTSPAASSVVAPTRQPLRKCMSLNDAEIMSALNRCENKDEPDLIGDFSKPYILPLIEGRHRDLKSISSHTVSRLLNGEFDDQVASYKIIDCRYPYEYEGGHIRGAKNLYTQEQIIEEFLTQQKTEQQQIRNEESANKRNIIIFHCEFSSERGPKLSRFLRNYDRERNTNSYPALDYPEVYLLHNGYKEFYETHGEQCTPNAYRPMLEPSYSDEYRTFRAKTKTWSGDGYGGATQRLKKSRSRLLL